MSVWPEVKENLKALLRKILHKEWQEIWIMDTKGRRLYKKKNWYILKELSVVEIGRGHNNQAKTSLRTECMTVLNWSDSDLCESCGEKETVEHVIYNCKRNGEERKELITYLNIKGKKTWNIYWDMSLIYPSVQYSTGLNARI